MVFFQKKKKQLIKDLKNLSDLDSSIVFFISAKKLNKIIPYLKINFLDRKILICREMTKLYEEFIRKDINQLEIFDPELKGELTIVISEKKMFKKSSIVLSESDKINIKKMTNKLSIREIVEIIGYKTQVSKKVIYNYCLKLKNEK